MKRQDITPAEWRIMRVIWSKPGITSTEICRRLGPVMDWKEATVKTLLRRLVAKGALATAKQGRGFTYTAQIGEQATIDEAVGGLFSDICQHHAGQALASVVADLPMSKADIDRLQEILAAKRATAPEKVPCNCLPDEQDCEC